MHIVALAVLLVALILVLFLTEPALRRLGFSEERAGLANDVVIFIVFVVISALGVWSLLGFPGLR